MDFILEYYFDFGIMGDEFGRILDGFWVTLRLSIIAGVLSLAWGLVLAAQSEGVIPREIGLPTFFGQTAPFWYGVTALTLTYGAYMAEVYRAGIEAIPRGQMEAARSLGMNHARAMRY